MHGSKATVKLIQPKKNKPPLLSLSLLPQESVAVALKVPRVASTKDKEKRTSGSSSPGAQQVCHCSFFICPQSPKKSQLLTFLLPQKKSTDGNDASTKEVPQCHSSDNEMSDDSSVTTLGSGSGTVEACEEDKNETHMLANASDITAVSFVEMTKRKGKKATATSKYAIARSVKRNDPLNVYYTTERLDEAVARYETGKTSNVVCPENLYVTYDVEFKHKVGSELESSSWVNLCEDGLYKHLKAYVENDDFYQNAREKSALEGRAFEALKRIILAGSEDSVTQSGRDLKEKLFQGFGYQM